MEILTNIQNNQTLTIMEKYTIKATFSDGSETIIHVECEKYDVLHIARGWMLTSSLIIETRIYDDDGKNLTTYSR